MAAILESIVSNPVGFGLTIAILSIIIFKHRLIWYFTRKAVRDQRAGMGVDAQTRQVRHETGIGTRDVLVMRPVKVIGVAIWGFLFFGGGAVFYALVVLQSAESTGEDWAVFGVFSAFALLAVYLFAMATTRICFDGTQIERTGLAVRRFSARLDELSHVTPLRKSLMNGMALHFADGSKLNVRPNMSGYRQLMEQLSSFDPKLRMMTKMLTNMAEGPR